MPRNNTPVAIGPATKVTDKSAFEVPPTGSRSYAPSGCMPPFSAGMQIPADMQYSTDLGKYSDVPSERRNIGDARNSTPINPAEYATDLDMKDAWRRSQGLKPATDS